MTQRKSKRPWAIILLAVLALASFSSLLFIQAYAQSSLDGDGTYTVPVDLAGLKMGADNFTSAATVEKHGDLYFFSFGHSRSIRDMTLTGNDKTAGYTVKAENDMTVYTYTVSYARLSSDLPFKALISAMGKEASFTIRLKLNEAKKISDSIADIGERPAEYVPTIHTSAANTYSLKTGTSFLIPQATATLGSEPCQLSVSAYYAGENVDIIDGKLLLDQVGTYKIVYRATSDQYKTMLGNDTFTEYTVIVHSTTGENDIVKLRDGDLDKNGGIIAGKLHVGTPVYEKAALAMSKIADNFEVYSIELISDDGSPIIPNGEISYLVLADGYFDRTSVEAYYMDENGSIVKIPTSNCGRYVSITTDKTGTFIICTPGVAFVMPMWGYAVITAMILAVVAFAIILAVIAVKRKRRYS